MSSWEAAKTMSLDAELAHRALTEAIRIGDELLSTRRLEAGQAVCWPSLSLSSDGETVERSCSRGLYDGTSGVSLFLAELYAHSGESRFLEAAREALHSLGPHTGEHDRPSGGLFTGELGIALAWCRVFQITGEQDARNAALAIALEYTKDSAAQPCDLLNGTAGHMLGLLHVHRVCGDARLLEAAKSCLARLLDRVEFGASGVYWDRDPQAIDGLCGLSHGSGGVAFALLELGAYVGNRAFSWLAALAFAHEDQHFDEELQNWPDLRVRAYTANEAARHLQLYRSDEVAFFSNPKSMLAWCHGAPGVGLARLRAYELLGLDSYAARARQAIARTNEGARDESQRPPSFTLCHGLGGNAELDLEASTHLGDDDLGDCAAEVVEQILEVRTQGGALASGLQSIDPGLEDPSLFLGNAGVGMFLLRARDPRSTPSILAPAIARKFDGDTGAKMRARAVEYDFGGDLLVRTTSELALVLWKRAFPRSLAVLRALGSFSLPDPQWFWEGNVPRGLVHAFQAFVEDKTQSLDEDERAWLDDILALETRRLELDSAPVSHALRNMRGLAAREDCRVALALDDPQLRKLSLRVAPTFVRHESRWSWKPAQDDPLGSESWEPPALDEPEATVYRLEAGPMGIREIGSSTFLEYVLESFEAPCVVEEGIANLVARFDPADSEQAAQLAQMTSAQIREALRARLLIPML